MLFCFLEYKCYEQLRKMKSHFEANPMWDFLHGEEPKPRERELSQTFKDYKQKHSKSYDHHLENHKRKNIFRHNSRLMLFCFRCFVFIGHSLDLFVWFAHA